MVERARPLVAGNWKMNGLATSLAEARAIAAGVGSPSRYDCEVMLCPPATLLMALSHEFSGKGIGIGGQTCHAAASGAHTGDLSAEMLADAGASAVIVGHSERRSDHGERDRDVAAAAAGAHRAGLTAIVCLGETLGQRRAGLTREVVLRQLDGSLPATATPKNTVLAYEPVWAIGTGVTATPEDVAEVHRSLRDRLVARLGPGAKALRILYGGSVKPGNARELMSAADVDGALVGGASLKATDFLGILAAYGPG